MRNDVLNVIKKQNWGALENFGFKRKKVTEKYIISIFVTNFFFQIRSLNYLQYIITHTVLNFLTIEI